MELTIKITDRDVISELNRHTDKQKFLEEVVLEHIKTHQNNTVTNPIELTEAEIEEIFGKESENPKSHIITREELDEMINDENFWD